MIVNTTEWLLSSCYQGALTVLAQAQFVGLVVRRHDAAADVEHIVFFSLVRSTSGGAPR
jgi:hypothetical protein